MSDAGIFSQLKKIPLKKRLVVFIYVSVKNEPDTREYINYLLSAGHRVCVPLCKGEGIMEARYISSLDELSPAGFGLLEPGADAPFAAPEELDLVIAPCVAADIHGVRLGYGGGYYDRFLPQVSCPVICLCRCEMLQQNLPAQGHDIKVAAVVTENGWLPEFPFCPPAEL